MWKVKKKSPIVKSVANNFTKRKYIKVLITDKTNKKKTKNKLKKLKKFTNKFALNQNKIKGGIAPILKKVKYNKPTGYLVFLSKTPKSVLNFKVKTCNCWDTGRIWIKKKKKINK
jgi:hypothetical protein